mmetsp:Transcript_5991/g.14268  ORF Transcript_5991/g.14268 Transcript_5991/m.14268 type:complete len:297 (-) Transcript_5991:137-1027(-)
MQPDAGRACKALPRDEDWSDLSPMCRDALPFSGEDWRVVAGERLAKSTPALVRADQHSARVPNVRCVEVLAPPHADSDNGARLLRVNGSVTAELVGRADKTLDHSCACAFVCLRPPALEDLRCQMLLHEAGHVVAVGAVTVDDSAEEIVTILAPNHKTRVLVCLRAAHVHARCADDPCQPAVNDALLPRRLALVRTAHRGCVGARARPQGGSLALVWRSRCPGALPLRTVQRNALGRQRAAQRPLSVKLRVLCPWLRPWRRLQLRSLRSRPWRRMQLRSLPPRLQRRVQLRSLHPP